MQKKIKIKPVQPSEIKDKNIARQAIAEARRTPTAEDWARIAEREDSLNRAMAK
ncbi:MAG: hypothetical protein Ta2A_24690 [Treponemataceae bacterium]|nr:MAG: hypothetical protein Ta2A_24690 [Treponemataceae bacterium]